MRFFFRALARLPLPALYAVSGLLYVVGYRLVGYRRRTVRDNLARVFPEKTAAERRQIERAYYRHLCRLIVETVKLLHISDDELRRRVRVVNAELIDRLAAEGRPIVLYAAHYGNWEWAQAITLYYSVPDATAEVYHPLSDPASARLMAEIRGRFRTTAVPQRQCFRAFLRMKEQYRSWVMAFIADQRPGGAQHHWTQFLGQRTAYAPGGDEIGRRLGAAFVYLDIECPALGHYRMTFRPLQPADPAAPDAYFLEYLRLLEARIRQQPAYWLWSHKRWKGE